MAEKLDTVMIRWHDDGRVGYHVEYFDAVTNQRRVVAVDSPDFPALDKSRIADIVGALHNETLANLATYSDKCMRLEQEIETLNQSIEQRALAMVQEIIAAAKQP